MTKQEFIDTATTSGAPEGWINNAIKIIERMKKSTDSALALRSYDDIVIPEAARFTGMIDNIYDTVVVKPHKEV